MDQMVETERLRDAKFNAADSIAAILLHGKVDKQGEPLILHARRVCDRCKHLSDEQRIAALLHDVIEENMEYKDPIFNTAHVLFGDKVHDILWALTRRVTDISYQDYTQHVCTIPAAIPVKLADLADNLDPSRGPIPDSLRRRYEWAKEYLELRIG